MKPSRPSRAKTREPRLCCECGQSFTPRKVDQFFCSTPHRIAFRNRCTVRGLAIFPLAMVADAAPSQCDPETRQAARVELRSIMGEYRREDREAGRPPMRDYVSALLATGFRHMDRKR